MTKKNQKTGRNVVVLTALVCLLMLGGSMAWLTSTSKLTNTFTVGEIKPIDPDKPGPGPVGPDGTGNPIDNDKEKLNGNLYEPNWTPNSKLMPGATIAKDPYVGVGSGSEAAFVYIYVNNTMFNDGNDIYFTINEGWEAVDTTSIDGENTNYTGGLFRYANGLDASKSDTNVWTAKPLFSEIKISDTATRDDFNSKTPNTKDEIGVIEVKSFIHQKSNGKGGNLSQADADNAAKAAFGINN